MKLDICATLQSLQGLGLQRPVLPAENVETWAEFNATPKQAALNIHICAEDVVAHGTAMFHYRADDWAKPRMDHPTRLDSS